MISGPLFCRAVFIRHGNTNYTDIFPDLTEIGIETINNTGKELKELIKNWVGEIQLISSPAVRAIGTANIISNYLEIKKPFVIEPLLRDIDKSNKDIANKIFLELLEKGSVDVAYLTDPRFDDGIIFESRRAVRKRLFIYLNNLLIDAIRNTTVSNYIHTTHYEIISHLFNEIFHPNYSVDKTVSYGEPMIIDFFLTRRYDEYVYRATFRQTEVSGLFIGGEFNSKLTK